MLKVERVLIMAGGTGGHIFPALAVAHLLRSRGIAVAWLGTEQGMERSLLADEGISLYILAIEGFRGKGWKNIGKRIWKAIGAFIEALKIMHSYNPHVVLGMGGFVSGPGGLAALVFRKRLVIHEQNAVLGLANRILSYLTPTVLLGFEKTLDSKGKLVRGQYVGNPLRPEILKVAPPELRFKDRSGPIRFLIFAGSQGSETFNKIVPEALAMLAKETSLEVWHQTGARDSEKVIEQYKNAGIKARVEPFITDMALAYEWADCVIARSGALTVSEISAVGLLTIFIPYPYHKDEQQKHNARALVEIGAAFAIDQRELNPKLLLELLRLLCLERKKLYEMAVKAYTLRVEEAAEKIVKVLTMEK